MSVHVNNLSNILLKVKEKERSIEKKTVRISHNPKLVGAMIGSFIENGKVAVMQQNRSIDLTCAEEEKLKQHFDQGALAHVFTQLVSNLILHANTAYKKSFHSAAVGPPSALTTHKVCLLLLVAAFYCSSCTHSLSLFLFAC